MTDKQSISVSLSRLEGYCRELSYKGWDPYDGLNSRVFKTLPVINDFDAARLAWIQLFKRNPVNLRKLFLVPKGYNPKGIALMLNGYCNLSGYQKQSGELLIVDEGELSERIRFLADLLISLRSHTGSNIASWGYNFDWQARRLFLFPAGTPTVVVTSFCASALFSAYGITKNEEYLSLALSSADFVLNDLHRTPKKGLPLLLLTS